MKTVKLCLSARVLLSGIPNTCHRLGSVGFHAALVAAHGVAAALSMLCWKITHHVLQLDPFVSEQPLLVSGPHIWDLYLVGTDISVLWWHR